MHSLQYYIAKIHYYLENRHNQTKLATISFIILLALLLLQGLAITNLFHNQPIETTSAYPITITINSGTILFKKPFTASFQPLLISQSYTVFLLDQNYTVHLQKTFQSFLQVYHISLTITSQNYILNNTIRIGLLNINNTIVGLQNFAITGF